MTSRTPLVSILCHAQGHIRMESLLKLQGLMQILHVRPLSLYNHKTFRMLCRHLDLFSCIASICGNWHSLCTFLCLVNKELLNLPNHQSIILPTNERQDAHKGEGDKEQARSRVYIIYCIFWEGVLFVYVCVCVCEQALYIRKIKNIKNNMHMLQKLTPFCQR